MTDEFIEKRKVVMLSVTAGMQPGQILEHRAEDYVPLLGPNGEPGYLEAYIADAQTRWQQVYVESDEHDAGPGGDEGETYHAPEIVAIVEEELS